jgi:hypothetical protein
MNLQGPRSSAPDGAELSRLAAERAAADRRYNEALTDLDRAIVAAGATATPGRDDLLRVATAVIVFLQQITGFVETKDREAAARTTAELSNLSPTLESIREIRTQVSVLQRSVASLARAAFRR